MAELKPTYLIHGDDDAKIDEWRTRLRRRAESELGPGGLESFDPRAATPEQVAAALATLTFATGTRYLLADDAGAWKAAALEPLTNALASMPPDTVLVLIVRGKPLKGLVKAVEAAGGEVREYGAPKPWEMPKWVIAYAKTQGLTLDPEAAKTLVGIVGTGQQRLARELEKLAIAVHPGSAATSEEVEEVAAGATAPKVYDLADALVAGNLEQTIALAEELRAQDESPSRLFWPIVNRLREVRRVVELLDAGVGEQELAATMGLPPWRIKKALPLARSADRGTLERALCRFADLELDLRGGGTLDEDTAVTVALARSAG